ncbi:MAG: hypothetical protein DI498_02535 [Paracoccus denitrificans]|nr:MAG: hypothetical protein DI498_02535 [Paracoccus denitrificans]PZO86020.1 MAG: hypothetical protein DI633_02535 [Paracoccus denitrificans]
MATEADFDREVAALRGTVATAGAHGAWDGAMRARYSRAIDRMSAEMKNKVRAGKLTWAQAAHDASVQRNVIMDLTRGRTSAIGQAWASDMKAKGLSPEQAIRRQTAKIFGPNAVFDALTPAQQQTIYGEVVSRRTVKSARQRSHAHRLDRGAGADSDVAGRRHL